MSNSIKGCAVTEQFEIGSRVQIRTDHWKGLKGTVTSTLADGRVRVNASAGQTDIQLDTPATSLTLLISPSLENKALAWIRAGADITHRPPARSKLRSMTERNGLLTAVFEEWCPREVAYTPCSKIRFKSYRLDGTKEEFLEWLRSQSAERKREALIAANSARKKALQKQLEALQAEIDELSNPFE